MGNENGWTWYVRIKPGDLRAVELLHRQLGEAAFSKVWQEGQALTLDEVVALTLAVENEYPE